MKTLKSITETFKAVAKHDQGTRKPGDVAPPKKFKDNTPVSLKGNLPAPSLGTQEFVDDHQVEVIPDANGNKDDVFKATNIKPIDRKKERHGHSAKESEEVNEMSAAQLAKREEIVKSMKKSFGDFKKRYGQDAKSVMYATATKQAMKEEIEDVETLPTIESVEIQENTEQKYDCILEAVKAHKEEQNVVEAYASILEAIYEGLDTQEEKEHFAQLLESDDAFDQLIEIVEQVTAESIKE